MDAIYRYQRYIYDASRKYFLLGRDRVLDELAPPPGATVLEIGCGTGRNLIKAARRYPQARFYGLDISSAMLDTARTAIARRGLSRRIVVGLGDATAFSPEHLFGVPTFDRVFISYALSMIPPWRDALRQGYEVLSPGGALHIVDFGEQTGYPQWFRKALRLWLERFSVEPRAELPAELRRLAAESGADLTFEQMFRDYARRAVLVKS